MAIASTLKAKAIRNCLAKAQNKSRAACELGISRSTSDRETKEHGLAV
jgi:transcriptional regulator with PAS, ATPase and Fis domain